MNIKNEAIREMLKDSTAGDPVMEKFLTDIIDHEYVSSQFRKFYKDSIEAAIGKGEDR